MRHIAPILTEEFTLPNSQDATNCEMCGLPGDVYGNGLYLDDEFRILSCPKCALIWTNPLMYQASTSTEEGEEYWAEDVYLANSEAQKQRFRQQLAAFLKTSGGKQTQNLRLLEVGSGLGFFLDVCEEFGINAVGCDIDAEAVRYANRERIRSRLGTLDDSYVDNSFNAIFAFNLIEHLHGVPTSF